MLSHLENIVKTNGTNSIYTWKHKNRIEYKSCFLVLVFRDCVLPKTYPLMTRWCIEIEAKGEGVIH